MKNPSPAPEFRQLGDHVALDMINTIEQADTDPLDRWQSDADVQAWLESSGLAPARSGGAPKGLLEEARALREVVRQLVAQRKANLPLKLNALNRALGAGGSHLEIAIQAGVPVLARQYAVGSAGQWLVPAAEAAADLLANGDFELVRKCESATCSLWFYDRTRSHRRRWCSMALCGNRHKVAAFRQREAQ